MSKTDAGLLLLRTTGASQKRRALAHINRELAAGRIRGEPVDGSRQLWKFLLATIEPDLRPHFLTIPSQKLG